MSESLSCWKWRRDTGGKTSIDFWGYNYPGAAEKYDTHEVTIVYWD